MCHASAPGVDSDPPMVLAAPAATCLLLRNLASSSCRSVSTRNRKSKVGDQKG